MDVSGNVYARAVDGSAYGVTVVGDSTIFIGGNATAIGLGNATTAVYGNSSGAIHVQVGGNVYADAEFGNATGVDALAHGGDSGVYVNGGVLARSQFGNATGVSATSTGDAGVTVGGSVRAYSADGAATGVSSSATDDSTVYVTGNVTAEAPTGATGVDAFSSGSGNATAKVFGNVTVISSAGGALGVEAQTLGNFTAHAYVGGNVVVMGDHGALPASKRLAGDNAYVDVKGNIVVGSFLGEAVGAEACSYYRIGNVVVHGDVTAVSIGDIALGVCCGRPHRLAYARMSTGTVTAQSTLGAGAIGVTGEADGYVEISVDGSELASGNIAAGILGESTGGGTVSVLVGEVTAHQYAGSSANNSGAGIRTYTTGLTEIDAADVVTTGDWTDGIKAGGNIGGGFNSGNAYVTVDNVSRLSATILSVCTSSARATPPWSAPAKSIPRAISATASSR